MKKRQIAALTALALHMGLPAAYTPYSADAEGTRPAAESALQASGEPAYKETAEQQRLRGNYGLDSPVEPPPLLFGNFDFGFSGPDLRFEEDEAAGQAPVVFARLLAQPLPTLAGCLVRVYAH